MRPLIFVVVFVFVFVFVVVFVFVFVFAWHSIRTLLWQWDGQEPFTECGLARVAAIYGRIYPQGGRG